MGVEHIRNQFIYFLAIKSTDYSLFIYLSVKVYEKYKGRFNFLNGYDDIELINTCLCSNLVCTVYRQLLAFSYHNSKSHTNNKHTNFLIILFHYDIISNTSTIINQWLPTTVLISTISHLRTVASKARDTQACRQTKIRPRANSSGVMNVP